MKNEQCPTPPESRKFFEEWQSMGSLNYSSTFFFAEIT